MPREHARRRVKRCMIILVISAIFILVAYISLDIYFKSIGKLIYILNTTTAFGVLRALGMSISACLLTATIWKLKSAKVDKTDTGHLNLLDASVLLILQILMILTGILTILMYREHHEYEQIYIDISRDVIDFLIAILYFKMITNFITKFKL